ncbi:ferric reductase-like transmembrane domain-containing protein [Paenibacillus cremeus]|nr:ferric reductase-like transmembrane domain-containing protein [Paenibacillus cremeus]
MTQLLLTLPSWWIIRIAGLGAYALLYIGVMLGITYSMPALKGQAKSSVYRWHMLCTNGGLLLAVAHVLFLLIDTYSPFTWQELLIPFHAAKNPVWNGLGTLSLYGLLLVLFTTDFKAILNSKAWRVFHLLSYPVFLAAMLHGLGAGTDSKVPWILGFYVFTCVTIVVWTGIRVWIGLNKAGGKRDAHLADGR